MIELLIVVGIAGIVAALAMPMTGNALGNFRLTGDARSLANALSLTKLRAASDFSKARLYLDRTSNAFHVETWNKTAGAWVTEGGSTSLSSVLESYSFGAIAAPPANTQPAIAQAPQCLSAAGVAIGNTSCAVFNSRGVPVTDSAGSTGAPTNLDAFYITDGSAVFGVTVSATSVIQLWRANPVANATWTLQ